MILDGTGEDVASIADRELASEIVAAWDARYGRLHPDPVAAGMYRFSPRSGRA